MFSSFISLLDNGHSISVCVYSCSVLKGIDLILRQSGNSFSCIAT